MQLGMHDFVQQRRNEGKLMGRPFVCTGGIHLPLGALGRVALADLQQRLTVTPRATFDRTQPPDPITCFRLTSTHLVVPRAFGYKRCRVGAAGASDLEDRLEHGTSLPAHLTFQGTLREEQREAQALSVIKLQAPPFSCMLTLPCGFGKTVVALSIAMQLGFRTLVVVHKEFLLSQWKERIQQFVPGATVGIIQGSRVVDPDADILLGMLQSLCNRLPEPQSEASAVARTCGLVVIDEAHHMAARSFSELFFVLPVRHVLGLTATPKRKDGCTPMLHMFMGDFSFTREERLTTEVMLMRQVPYSSGSPTLRELSGGQIQRLKTALTEDRARNALILRLCQECVQAGRQVLCLSDRLAHLRHLLGLFQAAQPAVTAALYVGGQKRAERDEAEKRAQILFGTYAMAQEGLDVPRLDTLVLASPASDVTQAVGRILRPCSHKATPLVLDIQDDACCAFSRQNQHRANLYRRMGFRLEPTAPVPGSIGDSDPSDGPASPLGGGGVDRSVRRRVHIEIPCDA